MKYKCPYCTRVFNTQQAINAHKGFSHKDKLGDESFKLFRKGKKTLELDITNDAMTEARKIYGRKCNICGRRETVSSNKNTSKANQLAVDHIHGTNTFRGFLCMRCNTNLGWYEKYAEALTSYQQPFRNKHPELFEKQQELGDEEND